jgi:hypothetical protein
LDADGDDTYDRLIEGEDGAEKITNFLGSRRQEKDYVSRYIKKACASS